ncbi:cyclin-dependent kinase 9-like [Montipora foliosa]|uniref:cyclin-dependent kinase 9-like n=1 Tax=Montipora foliosa TaxID=591990 RepID=UPI0035F10759
MAFKLPSLKGRVNSNRSLISHGLPLFDWIQLQDKEKAIGRGSFGLVFLARANGEKVVVKKLLSEDEQEQRLFLIEAKILHGIKSEHVVKFKAACTNPCAMMLEYLFFDFAPFGGSDKVSSLDKFLQYVHINEALDQFALPEKIASETAAGLAHLHDLGIVHRDIKPSNVLVSNQIYCSLEDRQELEYVFQARPIICKLADFGESRSAINQTSNHECLPHGYKQYCPGNARLSCTRTFPPERIKLSLEDLKAVDVWALGMLLFVIINSDLKYPYQFELEKIQTGNYLSGLENLISKNEKPAHSDHYCRQHAVNCLRLRKLYDQCTRFHPI